MNHQDHIRAMGYLALGSRMKRISDACYQACNQFYDANGVAFDASNFPLLTLLDQEQSMSISDAATALGISHAAASQKASQMVKAGWAKLKTDKGDKRSKQLSITPTGRDLVIQMQPLWYSIRQTVQEIDASLPQSMLEVLDGFETAINDADLPQRMASNLRHYYADRIDIVRHTPQLAPYFESLNREWIETYFKIEPHDAAVLGDPQSHIIDRGGMVYYAMLDGEVVATAALYKEDNDCYEFTKMGTRPHLRGKGVGRQLMRYIINDAKERLGAKRIYILTSSQLNPAGHLYRSLGFVDIPLNADDRARYERADVKLELWLDENAKAAA